LAENGASDYALSGTGAINVTNRLTLGWHGPSESTLVQTGGTINVDQGLNAAQGVGFVVGDAGTATYTIEAGTLNVPRHARIANAAGAVGQMNVAGGSVHIGGDLDVGMAGNGTLTQSGGE